MLQNRTHNPDITHYIYKKFLFFDKFHYLRAAYYKAKKEYSLTANINRDNDKKKEQRDAARF